VAKELARQWEAEQDVAPQTGGSETILVCEDEAVIQKLIHTMLTKLGYRVIQAARPDQAIEIVKQDKESIDLLLTDVVMPQINGFELAAKVREMKPGLSVLYMSGYTDNQIGNSWMLGPDTPLLHKPFTAAALNQKLRATLEGKAAGAP
jgi:CheY-like chemotaxis protein